MEPKFLNRWSDENTHWRNNEKGAAHVFVDFQVTEEQQQGVEIILASYGGDYYEGDAFVLFRKDGKLYEVNGSHCSCYGLEDQWEPEETTLRDLRFRMEQGHLGGVQKNYCGHYFREDLVAVIEALTAEGYE